MNPELQILNYNGTKYHCNLEGYILRAESGLSITTYELQPHPQIEGEYYVKIQCTMGAMTELFYIIKTVTPVGDTHHDVSYQKFGQLSGETTAYERVTGIVPIASPIQLEELIDPRHV